MAVAVGCALASGTLVALSQHRLSPPYRDIDSRKWRGDEQHGTHMDELNVGDA